MWREAREMTKTVQPDAAKAPAAGGGSAPAPAPPTNMNPLSVSFEAGQIFQKFDTDKDGRLDKKDFESLLKTHPELVKPSFYGAGNAVSIEPKRPMLPTEVVTGRLLTHYDETAGVAIPHSSVERHRSLGNTVVPLTEAYRARYDRLRSLLTSRLLPRREHLLQLRRQLQVCSSEVAATRKGIERETISDTEQILERLRSVEAMRQSAIKHQVRG
jgi:EF-hand domain